MPHKISVFKNVSDKYAKDFDLDTWLKYTIDPPKRLIKLVNKYKETFNENDKWNLPCISVSARFNKIRSLNDIKEKLPFICLDIDRYSKKRKKASNDCIDMLLVKEMFINHPSCYYTGFSLSGENLMAIFILSEKDKLNEYFNMLKERLSLRGVNIDVSCSDYTRLRFFNYDSEAYYNPNAKPLKLPVKKVYKPNNIKIGINQKSDLKKVQSIIEVINRTNIDITGLYEDWIKIAASLNNAFGEQGRAMFHEISNKYSDYDYKKCDKKFDQCKKMNNTTLGSLFMIASDHGVRY